jgi:SAM-dependent methyltransferase
MDLVDQYDKFYGKTELIAENLVDLKMNGWPKDRTEAIIFSVKSGESVLDVGSGNGNLLYQLRSKFTHLIGLEYSPKRMQQAELNLAGHNFTGALGSAERMNAFDSNSIDCIVSADTIEHIPDVYLACQEFFRVLRPGGSIIINTPNIAFVKKRALLLFGRFPSTSQKNEGLGSDILFDGGHLHYFTFRSLSLLLVKSGFQIDSRIGYGKFGRIHNIYPQLLSGGAQVVAHKPVV